MSLLTQLSAVLGDAFASLGLDRDLGAVVVSQRPELAHFQCNGAMAAAKSAGRSPRDLAEAVVAAVAGDPRFAEVSVAGPGFVNLTLTDEALSRYVDDLGTDARLGVPTAKPARTVVDYGGPNVAKELHVGHVRPAVIGESIKRTLRFLGHDVVGDVHLGDWGAPMGQLIAALEDEQPDLPYFDPAFDGPYPVAPPVTVEHLQDMYPVASARVGTDPGFAARAANAVVELQEGRPGYRALWQHFRDVSVEAIRAVYDRLGVDFDLWYGESTIIGRLGPLLERLTVAGVAVPSEGALVVVVAEPGDTKEIPPLMLVKSDGATLYTTWDVATIEDRVEDLGAEVMIYVVDVRQALHFEQVFRAVRKAGIVGPDVELEHAGNGTVNGPDGRPLRTRDGGLVRLRDLIDQIVERAAQRLDENHLAEGYPPQERARVADLVGLAALKFGDLHNHRTSNYIFDLERFTSFDGKTGPYLLYGAVRMKSILRNARDRGLVGGPIVAPVHGAERNLMLQLVRLPEVVQRAADLRAPNHLAEYAYELAADFSRFYESCHILREEDPATQASWLTLVTVTLRQSELLLDLLGIEVPDRM
jgi:arginyl-tRNA synthetase